MEWWTFATPEINDGEIDDDVLQSQSISEEPYDRCHCSKEYAKKQKRLPRKKLSMNAEYCQKEERTDGMMNVCDAGIHLGVDPDVAAKSSKGLKENEGDERWDLYTGVRRYDWARKNRRRDNVPPRQGIFRHIRWVGNWRMTANVVVIYRPGIVSLRGWHPPPISFFSLSANTLVGFEMRRSAEALIQMWKCEKGVLLRTCSRSWQRHFQTAITGHYLFHWWPAH